jgi:hypothetical protein
MSTRLSTPSISSAAAAVMSGVLLSFALVITWNLGATMHLGVAGLLPVSDAMGYFRCALMGAEGSDEALRSMQSGSAAFGIPGEWCSRRSVWPLSLVSLQFASGWHSGLTLLIQAFLVGAAVGLLVEVAWRAYGIAAGALAAWLGVVFAFEWAIGTFMTENWGIVAGFSGAALLIEHAKQHHAGLLILGLAMVSVALAARAGALFVLPLLLLWGYVTLLPRERRWSAFALAVPLAGLLVGPALQWLGAHHFVADASNTGGNFGPSLYGLSTGSRDWSQAYRDFAELFSQRPEAEVFKIVQQRAVENIMAHPTVFLGSLADAAKAFRTSIFLLGSWSRYPDVLTALLVIGVLSCAWRWRNPLYSLPLLVFAAECIAAPLIIDSGGQRVFAATVWVRPVLAGIGVAALVEICLRIIRSRDRVKVAEPHRARPLAALVFACCILIISILPLMLPSGTLRPTPVAESVACAPGEIPAIARVGRESMALSISDEARLPLRGPLLVPPGRIEADMRWQTSWWSNGTMPIPLGSTVLLAFDARPESRGQLLSVFSEHPLPPSGDGVYRLCAGEPLKRTLGDFPLRALVRVEALRPLE